MKILIVGRYKKQFPEHLLPFVLEQGEALKEAGVEIEYYAIKGSGPFCYFNTKPVKKIIENFKPDIIHAHYGLSGITAVLQRKVPVVITFHNGETLNKWVNLLTSYFSLKAKHVIYVAQHIYDKCYFKSKNFSIEPCGVNLEECVITDKFQARKELAFNDNKKYILFGGAFANLRKNYPLLEQAIKLTNRNDIEVLEMKGLSRKQISLLLSACDLFALPTKSEGSPQALKEAMACNCPIMATDVADIKHLLGNLDGHFICSFNPREVAETLNQALSFTSRTNGRERIVELGLDNKQVADKLIEIYNKIPKPKYLK